MNAVNHLGTQCISATLGAKLVYHSKLAIIPANVAQKCSLDLKKLSIVIYQKFSELPKQSLLAIYDKDYLNAHLCNHNYMLDEWNKILPNSINELNYISGICL